MNYSAKTQSLISSHKSRGFRIVENRDPRWDRRNNRSAGSTIVKLAHTNDKMNGYPKRIVWAIK